MVPTSRFRITMFLIPIFPVFGAVSHGGGFESIDIHRFFTLHGMEQRTCKAWMREAMRKFFARKTPSFGWAGAAPSAMISCGRTEARLHSSRVALRPAEKTFRLREWGEGGATGGDDSAGACGSPKTSSTCSRISRTLASWMIFMPKMSLT